jgi:hypothetical protein
MGAKGNPRMNTQELTCNGCGITFDLERDGGSIERALNIEEGTFFNTEVHCAKCNTGQREHNLRVGAATRLLEGTGVSIEY